MSAASLGRNLPIGVVMLVLLTSPFGLGGREADILWLHQSVVVVATLISFLTLGARLRIPTTALWIVIALGSHALLLARYRYAAGLVAMDWLTAVLVALLVGAAPMPNRTMRITAAINGASVLNLFAGSLQWLRSVPVVGLFDNPHYGAGLAALAGCLLVSWMSGVGSNRWRPIGLIVLGINVGYIVLLSSRGGMLAMIVGSTVALVTQRRARLLYIGFAIAVLALILPTPLSRRMHSLNQDPFAYQRPRIWAAAWSMGVEHAWRGGAGFGSFQEVARRYNFPVEGGLARFGKVPNHAHQEWLQLFAEGGMSAVLVGLLPLVWAGRRILNLERSRSSDAFEGRITAAGLATIVAHSLVDANLHSPAILYSGAALIGCLTRPWTEGSTWSGRKELRLVGFLVGVAYLGLSLLPWIGDRDYRKFQTSGDRRDLESALRWSPGHAGYHRAIALAAGDGFFADRDVRTFELARFGLEQAIRLDPGDSVPVSTLARFEHRVALEILPSEELAEDALRHYRKALELDPFNPFLWTDYSLWLGGLGRLSDAHVAARRAVQLEPNCVCAWQTMKRVCLADGNVRCADDASGELERLGAWARTLHPTTPYERSLLEFESNEVRSPSVKSD